MDRFDVERELAEQARTRAQALQLLERGRDRQAAAAAAVARSKERLRREELQNSLRQWAEPASPQVVCARMAAAVEWAGETLGEPDRWAEHLQASTLAKRGAVLIQYLEEMTDGVTLCRLANAVSPGAVPRIITDKLRAERRLANIPALESACAALGVPGEAVLTVEECAPALGGMMKGRHTRISDLIAAFFRAAAAAQWESEAEQAATQTAQHPKPEPQLHSPASAPLSSAVATVASTRSANDLLLALDISPVPYVAEQQQQQEEEEEEEGVPPPLLPWQQPPQPHKQEDEDEEEEEEEVEITTPAFGLELARRLSASGAQRGRLTVSLMW